MKNTICNILIIAALAVPSFSQVSPAVASAANIAISFETSGVDHDAAKAEFDGAMQAVHVMAHTPADVELATALLQFDTIFWQHRVEYAQGSNANFYAAVNYYDYCRKQTTCKAVDTPEVQKERAARDAAYKITQQDMACLTEWQTALQNSQAFKGCK